MKKVFALLLLLGLCAPPAMAGGSYPPTDLKKGERVIVYDSQHRRVGTVENRGYGRTQMRNNQNQITGYVEGNRIYSSSHRRTGTVGKHWK